MTEKLTTAQKASERRDIEKKDNAAQLAVALTRTLSLGVFRGRCKCGLMLSEKDKATDSDRFSCPRCGRKAELLAVAVA